jgi:hypothetical protein
MGTGVYWVHPTFRIVTDLNLENESELDGVMDHIDGMEGREADLLRGGGLGGVEIWLRENIRYTSSHEERYSKQQQGLRGRKVGERNHQRGGKMGKRRATLTGNGDGNQGSGKERSFERWWVDHRGRKVWLDRDEDAVDIVWDGGVNGDGGRKGAMVKREEDDGEYQVSAFQYLTHVHI